ncbi:MAG: gamma-glutamyltransferase, partial [Oleibacter sp.]|nr:gamma-glutamyltransferase [Thalassolituus sp.]
RPVEDWVSRPRFHHQYLPDVIQYETDALSAAEIDELKAMGHELTAVGRTYGNMQAIHINKNNGKIFAASDPRGIGQAQVVILP